MSKFQQYHTIYLEAEEVAKEFPGENKNPGWYVFHPKKATAGPFGEKGMAMNHIGGELLRERWAEEKAAAEGAKEE